MNLAERVAAWSANQPSVEALVLIGSRVRHQNDVIWQPDAQSDWDFQVIASRKDIFRTSAWAKTLGLTLHTYCVRTAMIGGVPKVAALFDGEESDFVILPAGLMNFSRIAVQFGLHRRSYFLRRKLQDLAVIVRPGWRFLKGGQKWDHFYKQIVAGISDPRLDDVAVRNLADSFICDAVWTMRKIARGEFLAAQRMLHRSLAETNLRLLHEIKLRRRERTFPEARRAEKVLSHSELAAITVSTVPDALSLRDGVEKASATCRYFAHQLMGDQYRWPPFL
jgi:hypothetical protein